MAPPPKLPRFVALYAKTAKKYVKYQSDGGHGYKQILTAKSEQLSSSLAKFEIFESKSDPSMVHIRCCYNNKYLRIDSNGGRLVTASMDHPDENQSVWYSTLFQPELLTDGTVRLLHVNSGYYAQWLDVSANSVYRSWIHVISSDPLMPNSENILQVIDWDTLFALPRHVTFKGDNGLYLGLLKNISGATLRFEIGNERDESIVNEIVDLLDGTFRIKNVSLGAFWRVDAQSGEMRADDTSATPTPYSLFSATKVNENTISIRNHGNGKVCVRYTTQHLTNGLTATEHQITQPARLELTELVRSRRILDINFYLNDGWVYNKFNVILNSGLVVSNHTDKPRTLDVKIPYMDVKRSTWGVIVPSLKLGRLIVRIQPKEIPSIVDSTAIQMTNPFESSYVWGETTTKSPRAYWPHRVVLDPMKKVTIKLLATSITCEVPFNYTRYDLLDEGTEREDIDIKEDGMYTGMNYINVTVEVSAPERVS
ncbi:hypothetical protein LINGRAHAP2_LOCUS15185 [Linum grandiflorum]